MRARLVHVSDWEELACQAEFEPGKMARLCFVSIRQLERFFAENFRKTPREWAKGLQCRRARELIARGYTTKAAAAELKFANECHFCREFKKLYGVCPQTFAPSYRHSPEMSHLDNNVAFRQSISVVATAPSG